MLTFASSRETPFSSINVMSDATFCGCVFWYRSAYSMTRRSLYKVCIAGFATSACTLWIDCQHFRCGWLSLAHPQVGAGSRRKALLDLAELQQLIPLDKPTQLANQCDMFAYVPAKLSELRILFDESLHVRDRVDCGRVVCERMGLIRLHVRLQRRAEVTKRRQMVRLEEWVRGGRQRDFLARM